MEVKKALKVASQHAHRTHQLRGSGRAGSVPCLAGPDEGVHRGGQVRAAPLPHRHGKLEDPTGLSVMIRELARILAALLRSPLVAWRRFG